MPIPAPSAASHIDIDRSVMLPLITPVLSSIPLADASARVVELISKEVCVLTLFYHRCLTSYRSKKYS